MKKLIAVSAAGFAMLGLAACSDVDETTTQTVPAEQTDTMAPTTTAPAPGAAPADDMNDDAMGSDTLDGDAAAPSTTPVAPAQ
jgi:hypothetical protein